MSTAQPKPVDSKISAPEGINLGQTEQAGTEPERLEPALPELELTDEDVLDAMRQVPGYLDSGQRPLAEIMTAPALSIHKQASFNQIMRAFRRHPGRSMPVMDAEERLLGMLLRKDCLHACHIEDDR